LERPSLVKNQLLVQEIGMTIVVATNKNGAKGVLVDVEREFGFRRIDFSIAKKALVHTPSACSYNCESRVLIDSTHLADLLSFVLRIILNNTEGINLDVSHADLATDFNCIRECFWKDV
jgi:hypothetical protein